MNAAIQAFGSWRSAFGRVTPTFGPNAESRMPKAGEAAGLRPQAPELVCEH
jgi:hypothetical protein